MNVIAEKKAGAPLPFLLEQMEAHQSLFEKEIRALPIPVADVFWQDGKPAACGFRNAKVSLGKPAQSAAMQHFNNLFPATRDQVLEGAGADRPQAENKRFAVLFSGGPAAGGHNVVAGIRQVLGEKNKFFGVKNGPKGLLQGTLFEITAEQVSGIVNTGGFDFLGSDRTKIKTEEQYQTVKKTCREHNLDGLVVVGGDDSNTNAAMLAEYLFANVHADGRGVQVIGVPKTIDGDLQVAELLPISFGFDTATKIFSEMVGNILQDTPSSRKYWHFIKLMGRSASHVALEVALQTKPAVALISEEVAEKQYSLAQIVDGIALTVIGRASRGINHGVVLIPEGLIEFIPEMRALIVELNEQMALHAQVLASISLLPEKKDFLYGKLTPASAKLMAGLPDEFENMLLLDRDSHGNLQVSQIPTEKLLIEMCKTRIKEIQAVPEQETGLAIDAKALAAVAKFKFATNQHFFGYEGRCGAPSRFDAAFTFNLGCAAGSLLLSGKTGYMAALGRLDEGGAVYAIPLAGLIQVERRYGQDELVIEKALVQTSSPAFRYFAQARERWGQGDVFNSPGPRQLWGPVANQVPISVALNQGYERLIFVLGKEMRCS
jgi:pyrophosphate--fructose-6-phosphate 1-phosphotransferase